jgi:large subunit ribosomal protein L54
MTGLNHTKAGSDPIALEENEYPSWLWTLVDGAAGVKGGKKSKGNVEATPAEITREMRKQGKIAIKARNDLKN